MPNLQRKVWSSFLSALLVVSTCSAPGSVRAAESTDAASNSPSGTSTAAKTAKPAGETASAETKATEKKKEEPVKQQSASAALSTAREEIDRESPAEARPAAKTAKLFGRIEQIAGEANVKMPELKMQKARLDPREKRKMLRAKADETKYSGTITRAFPEDFRGNWGGQLQVWSFKYSPLALKQDRKEIVNSVRLLKQGRKGNVNFDFYRTVNGKTALQPATVLLSVPMKDTMSYRQMAKANPMFAGMGNMEMPMVKIYFGNAQTGGAETGVSGNQFRSQVYRNVIRKLARGVLEQQIVTRFVERVKDTGQINKGYDESVIRFTRKTGGRLYVLAASVKYTNSGKYLSKLIMYGTVAKGRKVNTNAMAGSMNKMMGGGGMLGGMFGGAGGGAGGGLNMNQLMKMMGGGGSGSGGNMNQLMRQMQRGGSSGSSGNINDLMRQMQRQMGR